MLPYFIAHHNFLPPIVKLSFSTFQFPGLSFPVHILTVQFSHPESFRKKTRTTVLVLYWATFYIMVHLTTNSAFSSFIWVKGCEWVSILAERLTCSCSEDVLTSWPALLLYCSLRLSRWTILLTSSSSWLKNLSSRSAGFTGLKKTGRRNCKSDKRFVPHFQSVSSNLITSLEYQHVTHCMMLYHKWKSWSFQTFWYQAPPNVPIPMRGNRTIKYKDSCIFPRINSFIPVLLLLPKTKTIKKLWKKKRLNKTKHKY